MVIFKLKTVFISFLCLSSLGCDKLIKLEPKASLEDKAKQRSITSHNENGPEKEVFEVVDKKWGAVKIFVTTYEHPVFSPVVIKVLVTCSTPIFFEASKKQKEIVVIPKLKACEFKGHIYDKTSSKLTLNYLIQSENATHDEPVCNEAWTQAITLSKVCS